jgi:hypothetical protein
MPEREISFPLPLCCFGHILQPSIENGRAINAKGNQGCAGAREKDAFARQETS